MNVGVITLVSDNYGNKYQNYAVEQLLKPYGSVITYRVEGRKHNKKEVSTLYKLSPFYIRSVLIYRMMYTYDMNNACRSVIGNVIYTSIHKKKLLNAKKCRHQRFEQFAKDNLNISEKTITRTWAPNDRDIFFCGSDQIWNPGYATTTELAFLSFTNAPKIALSPSFGVDQIPEEKRELYSAALSRFDALSVREKVGQDIIRELTGKEAVLLADPTLAISKEMWEQLAKAPGTQLPKRYVLCYFLGRVDKKLRKRINQIAEELNCDIVMLFDIEKDAYYVMDPAEVLYAIHYAEAVLTDSFHCTVFSILFHRNFLVFERNEAGSSLSSRLITLLETFGFESQRDKDNLVAIDETAWNHADEIVAREKLKLDNYIAQSINMFKTDTSSDSGAFN